MNKKNSDKILLKESEELILELVDELKKYVNQKMITQYISKNKSNVYSGVGSIQSTCTACQRRKFGL
jgi:hypothetical protein